MQTQLQLSLIRVIMHWQCVTPTVDQTINAKKQWAVKCQNFTDSGDGSDVPYCNYDML